jgi:hypothetical protein
VGRRSLLAFVVAAAAACLALSSCAHSSGMVRAEGGPTGSWALRPNRCKVGDPSPAWGGAGIVAVPPRVADLYYAGTDAGDTEVVVAAEGDVHAILVRVPRQGKMALLQRADCTLLDVETGYTGYTVNHEAGLTGHARFDCTRPEVGHVVGDVDFTCF